MEENNEGVKDLLKKLIEQNQTILENKETKPFKLPWKAKVKPKAVSKGFAIIQVIRNNGAIDFFKSQIDEDGCVSIDGFPRLATAEYRCIYKNTPLYIIPEWTMKPISLVDNYGETERDKMNISGRRVVLSKLEKETIKPKNKMNGNVLWWIIGFIVVIGGAYYFLKSRGAA